MQLPAPVTLSEGGTPMSRFIALLLVLFCGYLGNSGINDLIDGRGQSVNGVGFV